MAFLAPALPFITKALPAIGSIAGGLLGSKKAPSQGPGTGQPTTTTATPAGLPAELSSLFSSGNNAALTDFIRSGSADPNQELGRNLLGRTIAGQFLDPGNNPGLQSVLSRGANTIGQQLDTRFGTAGRDISASEPAFTDKFGSFTGDVLFNNFNAERGRQDNALSRIQDLNPIDQLLGRSGTLSQLLFGNQSTISPLQQDRLAGGVGGASVGSAVGRTAGDFLSGLSKPGPQASSGGGGRISGA